MKYNIAVLGSGSWGTALAILLSKNGHNVHLWSISEEQVKELNCCRENKEYLPGVPLPKTLICSTELSAVLTGKDLVVISVPSKAVREVVQKIRPMILNKQVIVNTSKGLEENSLKRMSEVIEEEIPQARIAVLSGPSHAEEVGRELPTTCVIASKDANARKFIQDLFMSPNFRAYTNPDLVGVELGGALKNVIALAAGICDGLGFGDNAKAALITRGIVEISRLGIKMGAEIQTFAGLSGIGDLIVTCTSMHSRNRRAGILIGQGKRIKDVLEEIHMVVEGVEAAKVGYALAEKYNVAMPIITEVYKIIFDDKDPKEAVSSLMERSKTGEHGDEDIISFIKETYS